MDFSYDEIRRIHRLEKNTSKLVEVEQEFYNDLNSFLSAEKKEYLDSLHDLNSTKARSFTNLKKMVEEIFSLREKKILNQALVASRTNEFREENMALQEKKMFREVLATLKKHSKILKEIKVNSDGFEYDIELMCKVVKKKHKIIQLPIKYMPRSFDEGKKINWRDGLIAFWVMLKFRL